MVIVLTIISLLIGGVLIGRDMLRNAQLQSVISDVERYKTAILNFKEKYKELPGDLPNAETFWGTDPGGCPSAANTTTKVTTCNGNGDSFIGEAGGTPITISTTNIAYEGYRAWQHLANAGFINSLYNGAISNRISNVYADPGINMPESKLKGDGFLVFYAKPVISGAGIKYYTSDYGHIMVFGAPSGTSLIPYGAAITPAESLALDQKTDDGNPALGNILSYNPNLAANANCATSATTSLAAYKTSATGPQCSLIFRLGF